MNFLSKKLKDKEKELKEKDKRIEQLEKEIMFLKDKNRVLDKKLEKMYGIFYEDTIENFTKWLAEERFKGYDNENNMLVVGRNYRWLSALEVYKNEVLLLKKEV